MSREIQHGNWSAFHAGILAGLTGQRDVAASLFDCVRVASAQDLAQGFRGDLAHPENFKARVMTMIEAERQHFQLPPLGQLI